MAGGSASGTIDLKAPRPGRPSECRGVTQAELGIDGRSGKNLPYYREVNNEVQTFLAAFRGRLAVMLKGPTGCGKTRLVEHVAALLGLSMYAVACHEDVTASDLVGRYVLIRDETVWVDGPLTVA